MSCQKSLFTIFLILSALLFSGCQSMGEKEKESVMKGTLATYANTLRWRDSAGLEQFFKDPEIGKRSLNPGYTVATYDVINSPAYLDEITVAQTVSIGYVNDKTQSYKTVMDDQIWEASDDGMTWLRSNQGPQFGK